VHTIRIIILYCIYTHNIDINRRFLRRRYNNVLYHIYYIYTRLLVAKDVGLRIPGPMSTGNRHHRPATSPQSIIYIYNRDRWSVFSLSKILGEINARSRRKIIYYIITLIVRCIVRRHQLQRQWHIAKSIICIYIHGYLYLVGRDRDGGCGWRGEG